TVAGGFATPVPTVVGGSATPPDTELNPVEPAPKKPSTLAPSELKLFGRDFFSRAASTYEPNPDASVPPNYVLGPGDTLSVLNWLGSKEYERADVTISPNGNIYLKLVGSIPLAEKTLAQAQAELRRRYTRFYKKFNLKVQVVGRRTIPVFVMGEVVKPGKYLLSSLSTVFTALYAAGGPSENGSLRRIHLTRRSQLVAQIDIYSYLVNGRAVDLPLRAGDTVYVPIAGKVVAIAGEVRRPAKYELRPNDSLGQALLLAGGTTSNSTERLRLSRVGKDRQRNVTELILPAAAVLPLRDGDEVVATAVLPTIRNAVYLQGAVNRPGAYAIEQAPTVAALLRLAEGITPEAYAEQAIITRLTEDLERSQITVNLRAVRSGQAAADVKLESGDIVQVYNRSELTELLDTVTVEGEVVNPGSYPYQAGMRVADLIRRAFGATTKAYLSQAQIYRLTVGKMPEMVTIDLNKALAGNALHNVTLQTRDRLLVRSRDDVQDLIVHVEGEVIKPGTTPFYEGMKVSDAIFAAGGLKPDVALDRALLVRLNPQTYAEELIQLSLRDALAHVPHQDLALQNGDRLTIYPSSQMGDLREVKIEGAVTAPGAYPYFGGMRVSHLLFLAKSLRDNAYSSRADLYRLRPDNTIEIIPVDIGKAAEDASSASNPLLQPRDRLVVSTREQMETPKIVKIDGFVRQPGDYRLSNGMKLSDLLHLAGGLKPDAQPKVDLYRVADGKANTITIPVKMVDGLARPTTDVVLEPSDLISVQGNASYFDITETITVAGKVQHPGAYPAYQGSRQNSKSLYEAITEAGGLLPDAYPAGIILYRKQSAIHTDLQREELVRTLHDLDASVGIITPKSIDPGTRGGPEGSTPPAASMPGAAVPSAAVPGETNPAAAPPSGEATANAAVEQARAQNIANISRSLSQVITTDKGNTVVVVTPPRSMQEQQFNLSIPVDAEPIIRSQGRSGDFKLEPGDVVYVPKRPTTVTVLGGVVSNGSVVYQDGKRLNYYLNAVGGVSPDGAPKRIVVMRSNGLVLPMKQVKMVQPGDIIIVPTKFIQNVIRTQSGIQRALGGISQTVLSLLPFAGL
ncbi:MAG TPA: SLBB domain-containing protein, partial [Abditibacteriaceae bacterium]|nr:SLBB domain-containing protein [Abditibacteriaceae bacterium]